MGKKKSKEHPSNNADNGVVSAPSNVFKSLFGDAAEQGTAASIFSENNPFKRKPQEGVEDLQTVDSEEANVAGPKKRRRNKEKNSVGDSRIVAEESGTPLEKKKTKKGENLKMGLDSNFMGTEDGGNGKKLETNKFIENLNKPGQGGVKSDMELGIEKKGKKNKKKRKRDELELEYEAKKYGGEEKPGDGEEKKLGGKVVGEKRKQVDNPADMMVTKEGFDDEGKLLRTVFVGNLPVKLKKKTLIKEFSQFGEVESVRIRSVPLLETKRPRKGAIMMKQINDSAGSVNAYVVFKTEESAQASLAHNMAVISGNHIRVDRACPPCKKLKGENAPLYDNKRTVFVGNLPFDVKEEELYQLFNSINGLESSVEGIRVVRDPNVNLGKGIAYVLFKTREAANSVTKKRNFKLRDRELRLTHARAESTTPAKRKTPSSPATTFKSPARKQEVDLKTPDSRKRVKGAMSYQGMRASKSVVPKKSTPKRMGSVKVQSSEKAKERKGKRPAVAARKAKALAVKTGGSQNAGVKRKMDGRTPDTAHRNKKARKFR